MLARARASGNSISRTRPRSHSFSFARTAVLSNEAERSAAGVQRGWKAALRRMEQQAAQDEALAPALGHFVKVSRSYAAGVFACYRHADLPRTNNDLEQLFGRHRYYERRASGRKVAGPSTVVRGGVKVELEEKLRQLSLLRRKKGDGPRTSCANFVRGFARIKAGRASMITGNPKAPTAHPGRVQAMCP